MTRLKTAGGSSDILLIFPPMFNPGEIYVSLPSLKSYIEMNGFTADIYDANINTNDIILSREFLEDIKYHRPINTNGEYPVDEKIIDVIDRAKETLKSEKFYEISEYSSALSVVRETYKYVNEAFSSHGGLITETYGEYSYQQDSKKIRYLLESGKTIYHKIFKSHIIPRIMKYSSKLFGISLTFFDQLFPSLLMAKMIKEYDKDNVVVVGGNLVTHLHKNPSFLKLLSYSGVDIAVIFEAERPLLDIVKIFNKFEDLSYIFKTDIPNTIYIRGDEYVKSQKVYLIKNLDDLPTPNYDGMEFEKYLFPYPTFSLLASRGCYWSKCVFCNIPYGFGPGYRTRGIKKILDDIRMLVEKYRARYIAFRDCSLSPIIIKNLSNKIVNEGLDIRVYAEVRAEKELDYETMKRAYLAGFRVMWVGIESYSQKILDLMRKGITVESIRKSLENMKKAGMWVHAYIILGFPQETLEDLRTTLNFISTTSYLDSVELSPFSLLDNSPLTRDDLYKDYGLIIKGKKYDLSLAYEFDYDEEHEWVKKRADDAIRSLYLDNSNYFFNLVIPSFGTWLLLYVSRFGVRNTKAMLRKIIYNLHPVSSKGGMF